VLSPLYLLQHMLNDEEATRAIRELNGAVLNGNRLNVEVCTVHIVARFDQMSVLIIAVHVSKCEL